MRIDLHQDLIIPFLDIYTKDMSSYSKDTCSIMFIAAQFIKARNWEQLNVPQQKNGYKGNGTFIK